MSDFEGTIFERLLHGIQKRKSDIELFLARGMAKNHEEYCRMVGEYTALSTVEEDIKIEEERYIAS